MHKIHKHLFENRITFLTGFILDSNYFMTGFSTQSNASLFIISFSHILVEELNIVDGLSAPRGKVGFPEGLGYSWMSMAHSSYVFTRSSVLHC